MYKCYLHNESYDHFYFVFSFCFLSVQPLHLSEIENCQTCECTRTVPLADSSNEFINDNDANTCFNVSSMLNDESKQIIQIIQFFRISMI